MATHGAWRLLALLLMALAAAVPGGRRAAADGTPVDLVLVLAVDVSGSVNTERFQLQKQGYADAFVESRDDSDGSFIDGDRLVEKFRLEAHRLGIADRAR